MKKRYFYPLIKSPMTNCHRRPYLREQEALLERQYYLFKLLREVKESICGLFFIPKEDKDKVCDFLISMPFEDRCDYVGLYIEVAVEKEGESSFSICSGSINTCPRKEVNTGDKTRYYSSTCTTTFEAGPASAETVEIEYYKINNFIGSPISLCDINSSENNVLLQVQPR